MRVHDQQEDVGVDGESGESGDTSPRSAAHSPHLRRNGYPGGNLHDSGPVRLLQVLMNVFLQSRGGHHAQKMRPSNWVRNCTLAAIKCDAHVFGFPEFLVLSTTDDNFYRGKQFLLVNQSFT